MLTGKQVRVRVSKGRLIPGYLQPNSPEWLDVAEQMLFVYRAAVGRTRGAIEAELAELLSDGPSLLVHQGLAKLLEDRCEYEVATELTPEQVREAAFRLSALEHAESARAGRPYDRHAVLQAVSAELGHPPEQLDQALFADLRDEQRVLQFESCTPTQLLHRYNTALAQAILLRAVEVEIRVHDASAARFRALFRQVKFRQLICTAHPESQGYRLTLDGPLSLFSAIQKYGLQLALFLPALLHCPSFDLRADVRWGTERKPHTFTLSANDGLRSHLPDFGVYTAPVLATFAANFRANVPGWALDDEPHPLPVENTIWVPDFTLTHTATGKQVYVEILGFWRRVNLDEQYRRLQKALPGQFILAVSGQYRTDESTEEPSRNGIYPFKRTPIAAEVAKLAAVLAGVSGR
ncbi:MAG: DUF790 family protein [Bacteroidales bacterium]|nr:DUF790 family protein [Bacteroidales bacterium]